ncbi:MAG: ABC transporter substrate-binding protein [Chloroflexota bacterium]
MSSEFAAPISRRQFVRLSAAAVAAIGLIQPTVARATAVTIRQMRPGTLTFVDVFEPKSYGDANGGIFSIREGIGQGLAKVDFQSLLVPNLATGWETRDAAFWRISLRPGVRFHNGVEMDAASVAFNLQRLAESPDAVAAFRGASVGVEDALTVAVRATRPVPFLPAILADGKAVIYEPAASFAADGSLITPVGTGPFRLADFRPGDRRVLEAHSAYWAGAPQLDEVQYLFVPQAQTRANMVRTGAADIARVISPADASTLQTLPSVQVLTTGLSRVRLLWFNVQRGVTADPVVRRALAHAIDRETMVQAVLENQGTLQPQLHRPEYPWGNPSLLGLRYDPVLATALLEQAGFGPSNPLAFTLTTYTSRPELPMMAQVIQEQLGRIGVRCELSVLNDDVAMSTAALRGELDALIVARNPLFLFDPQANYESDYSTTGSYNLSRYTGLDQQIAAAGMVTDPSDRFARYRVMEQQIIERDAATVVLSSYVQIDAVRVGVSGYQPHPTDALAITELVTKR